MSTSVKIGLCQTLVGEDKLANLDVARTAVAEAVSAGASFVSLPECFNSPYAAAQFPIYAETIPEEGSTATPDQHPTTHMLIETAKAHGIFLVGGSFPERDGDQVFNTCLVIDPEGNIVAKHRKMHLFDIDVPGKIRFMESDTLTGGSSVTTFDAPFGKVGIAICYDIRFPQLSLLMRDAGCKLLVYPGAFNMTTGPAHWELLQRARAVDTQCFVAAVSPARNPESTYQAWGHSSVISPWGKVIATTEHDPAVFTAELDFAEVDEIRQSIPVSVQQRTDVYSVSLTGGK